MLTPVDIENKEFTKAFRGYDIYEVEEFMKSLVTDYEKLYRDNAELKEKNAVLNDAIGSYKGMEETMQNAILVAQKTAEDIKKNAYERSETIVKEAERRAAEAVNQANRSISNLEKTYLSMQREMNGFKAKMNALLSTYMQLLSELPEKGGVKGFSTLNVPELAEVEESVAESNYETTSEQEDQSNTTPFTLPSFTDLKKEEEAPGCVAEPAVMEPTSEIGFETERKINPIVEELLQKKKEQAQQEQVSAMSQISESPVEQAPIESFSVTKETVQSDPEATLSSINLNNLKHFDVFSDDSI